MSVERRLVVGATLGILLAAIGVLRSAGRNASVVPPHAVAVVDGRPLPRAEYERRLAAVAADRRVPLDAREPRRVLERMIDEELLLGRALELELPRRDPQARKELVGAMVDAVVATAPAEPPEEAELRSFYEQNRDFFAPEMRLRLRSLWIRIVDPLETAAAETRAALALEALRAGEDFASVATRLADVELAPLPDAPLPLAKAIEYLGPSAARAAATLSPGQTSKPIRTADGIRLVQLVERVIEPAKSFADLRPRVLEEWRRRRDERTLREALAGFRAGARIALAADAPRKGED